MTEPGRRLRGLRDLALLIAVGWFWLLFYGVGPLTPASSLAAGGLSLAVGCLLSALWGVFSARRRPRR